MFHERTLLTVRKIYGMMFICIILLINVSAKIESAEWEHYFSSNILHELYCAGGYIWSFQPAGMTGLLQFNPVTKTFNHFHAGNGTKGNRILERFDIR